MNAFELLLSRRWILKSIDPQLYHQVRDELPEIRKFASEKLGYQIVVNPALIRMEKLPARPECWMGIQEFNDPLEYAFLCMVLMFLDDKGAGEQFVLSSLTEFVQAQYRQIQVDWTVYHQRKCLVKVLKFSVREGLIRVDDGNDENYIRDISAEVLYQNTGVSHYFMRNFTRSISNLNRPEDFEGGDWFDVNEDRGIVRRHRVYRRLLMSPGVYRMDSSDEDFNYIRNYRNMIAADFSQYLDCELQVFKSSAYLIQGEECRMGSAFPEENSLSDFTLLFGSLLRHKIDEGKISIPQDERIPMLPEQFRQLVEQCRRECGGGFAKKYREMLSDEFYRTVYTYMLHHTFIEEQNGEVILNPILTRIVGVYPKEFREGAIDNVE
ncbi:MAG: TIGR02678 family protein [Lachnospiraceae bacterium]